MKRFVIIGLLVVLCLPMAGCFHLVDEPSRISQTPTIFITTQAVSTLPPVQAATATEAIVNTLPPQAFNWKNWPELPSVSPNARAIYQRGLLMGNDPQHFSILGDCQSMPDIFMGRFETDEELLASLPYDLWETVKHFEGSFSRISPTIKPGTTAGAILWAEWIDRDTITYCEENETPLDCELRVWKPSIVLINLGTHWETRNYKYLTQIIDTLISRGILPILATKADNREGDSSINLQIAETSEMYDIPIWNFWSTVQGLANGGLKSASDVADLYLTDEGLKIHRHSALRAIDSVWRQLTSP